MMKNYTAYLTQKTSGMKHKAVILPFMNKLLTQCAYHKWHSIFYKALIIKAKGIEVLYEKCLALFHIKGVMKRN